jgi:F0F1-type ATP synthase assembly protein I
MIERIWIIVSSLLLIAAAVFLWRNNLSAAFVTAALGAVAWFLSYRTQLRARLAATEHDSSEERTTEDADEN